MGPEPFGMVYVPPNGNVGKKAALDIDFFHSNNLLQKADELGFTYEERDSEESPKHKKDKDAESIIKQKVRLSQYTCRLSSHVPDENSDKLLEKSDVLKNCDNSILCGRMKTMTERSIKKCSNLILEFVQKKNSTSLFMRHLFIPVWDCIKDEQVVDIEDIGWRYERSHGKLARPYWFCPPDSKGASGILGEDYFISEEAVIFSLLEELRSVPLSMTNFTFFKNELDTFSKKITRSIEENISFDEVINDQLDSSRSRSRYSAMKNNSSITCSNSTEKERKVRDNKKHKKEIISDINLNDQVESSRRRSRNNAMKKNSSVTCSNFAEKGREIRDNNSHKHGITINEKKDENEVLTTYPSVATSNGVAALIIMDIEKTKHKKRKHGSTPFNKDTEQKVKRVKVTPVKSLSNESFAPAYHMTQSPQKLQISKEYEQSTDHVLPLQGLAFFTSGVTGDTIAIIEKLGGTVLQKVVGHLLQTENIKKQLFFVSKPTSRRTHKYILAGALGVPMLNISWVSTINDRFEQYKLSVEQDSSSQTVNSPCPFDSHLFASHRYVL